MKKFALIAAAVIAVVVFHAPLGDLIAQAGQLLFWRLGWHAAGAVIISLGDGLAFWQWTLPAVIAAL